jgi:hypothetical protein
MKLNLYVTSCSKKQLSKHHDWVLLSRSRCIRRRYRFMTDGPKGVAGYINTIHSHLCRGIISVVKVENWSMREVEVKVEGTRLRGERLREPRRRLCSTRIFSGSGSGDICCIGKRRFCPNCTSMSSIISRYTGLFEFAWMRLMKHRGGRVVVQQGFGLLRKAEGNMVSKSFRRDKKKNRPLEG